MLTLTGPEWSAWCVARAGGAGSRGRKCSRKQGEGREPSGLSGPEANVIGGLRTALALGTGAKASLGVGSDGEDRPPQAQRGGQWGTQADICQRKSQI